MEQVRRSYAGRRRGLTRQPGREALQGIDLTVGRGELFALLGPNGAGKTTSIKILTTLLLPTSGTARVLGHDVARAPQEVRPRVGYVFGGDRGLYERLSARDNLRYFAELYGLPGRVQRRRIDELFELVGLAGREDDRVEGFSRGMRQRLHIARGLLHDPDVVFLDEPTIGIDPVGARSLRRTVAALKDQGKTIVLTTHYMFEADELADRIGVINHGRLVALGTPSALKQASPVGRVLELVVRGEGESHVARLRSLDEVSTVECEDLGGRSVIRVHTGAAVDPTPGVLRRLDELSVEQVQLREPTLEDAYVAMIETS